MKVNVEKIGKWKKGKHDLNLMVVTRGLDDGKYYNLNLNMEFVREATRWLPYIQEGRVLDVAVRTDYGKTHVDAFKHFTPGPRVAGKEATWPDGSLPHQASMI